MEIHRKDEFEGNYPGMRKVSREELLGKSIPVSEVEAEIQEGIRRFLFNQGLADIAGESRLEEWKRWGFDFAGIALEVPGVALDYVEHARNRCCDSCKEDCRDSYVASLQELSETQLSNLEDYLLPYATQELLAH